jgi:NAD(P)-dependent dehydrogenase (short-subunit alcohol dehydrogenase family)
VFGIMPGLLSPSGPQSLERYREDARKSPLGRGASAGDIHGAIAFFAATKNARGQDFAVDGGESLTARARDVAYE